MERDASLSREDGIARVTLRQVVGSRGLDMVLDVL